MSVKTMMVAVTFDTDDVSAQGMATALSGLDAVRRALRFQTLVCDGQPGTIEDWLAFDRIVGRPTPKYLQEFPDYGEYIELPKGWVDQSWHNDACPSFFHPAKRAVLFLDYADPKKRELTGNCRYGAYAADEDGGRIDGGWEVEGDDLHQVLGQLEYHARQPSYE